MAKVVLKQDAFLSMVLSSIEVYRKETYGLVIGIRKKKNYLVSNCFSFQTAKRHYDVIEIDESKERMINNHIKYLTNHKLLGDYHSHANEPDELSREDIRTLKNSFEGFISVLVVPKKLKNKRKYLWKHNRLQKCVSGSIGNFFVKIVAFYYDPKNKRAVKLQVYCPFIKPLNRKMRYHKKLEEKIEKLKKETKRKRILHKKLKQKLNA